MLDQLGKMTRHGLNWQLLMMVRGLGGGYRTHHSKISSLSLSSDDITVSLKKDRYYNFTFLFA